MTEAELIAEIPAIKKRWTRLEDSGGQDQAGEWVLIPVLDRDIATLVDLIESWHPIVTAAREYRVANTAGRFLKLRDAIDAAEPKTETKT